MTPLLHTTVCIYPIDVVAHVLVANVLDFTMLAMFCCHLFRREEAMPNGACVAGFVRQMHASWLCSSGVHVGKQTLVAFSCRLQ